MTIRLKLGPDERDVLRRLPSELLELFEGGPDAAAAEPALRRLFPPAYVTASPETEAFEAEYRRLMGSDLIDRHRAALQMLLETVDAEELTQEQAESWLIALNELRLVLGTILDVHEDEDDDDEPLPASPQHALYHYLTSLQGWLIDQLMP